MPYLPEIPGAGKAPGLASDAETFWSSTIMPDVSRSAMARLAPTISKEELGRGCGKECSKLIDNKKDNEWER